SGAVGFSRCHPIPQGLKVLVIICELPCGTPEGVPWSFYILARMVGEFEPQKGRPIPAQAGGLGGHANPAKRGQKP
ncbi:MAG TPA: hypothetical protein VMG63_09290, partial [Terriglobia bacterium]|nr:hypothetical protein [Terriglobia bacterium]